MTTKHRWIVYLGFLVVLYSLGTWGLRNLLILPRFTTLEQEEALRIAQRSASAVNRELRALSRTTKDHASWTELADYVANPQGEYLNSQLKWDYLDKILEVHLLCLTDLQGRVIWRGSGASVEDDAAIWVEMEEVAPSRRSSAMRRLLGGDGSQGILPTAQGILMLASKPIQPVGSSEPVTGILVMGRFLRPEMVSQLIEQVHVDFRIEPIAGRDLEAGISVVGPELLLASSYLYDLWGDPAALVVAEIPRTMMASARDVARIGAISIAIAITLIAVLAASMLRRTTGLEKLSVRLRAKEEELRREIARGATEVSLRKKAERALRRSETKLKQAEKSLAGGALVGGVAHDFNNLLQIMLGYLDMARSDAAADRPVVQSLDEAMTAGKRAVDLVEQMLALNLQSKAGRRPLRIQPIIEDIVKRLRPGLPSTVEIAHSVDETCKAVLANAAEIHLVVMTLSTRALDSMAEEGGVLDLRLRETKVGFELYPQLPGMQGEAWVRLSVSDTGRGMDESTLEQIFESDFTTTETDGHSTGVSLATVREIIEASGGTILVESELGRGTRFDAYFPIALERVEEDESEAAEEQIGARGTERLFFVDDEPMIVEQAELGLRHLGFEVEACSSSQEAWEILRERADSFDVVIADQVMPNMTGLQLARQLSRVRPELPVILCTGYSELVDEDTAKAAGIRRYARKPILPRALAAAIREILDEQKSDSD